MRRRLSAGTIAGVGVATASLTLLTILTSEFTSDLVFVTEAIVPLLFSALLVGAGYWTASDQTDDSAMVRLAAWCLAGATVVGGFEFLTIYSQFESGAVLNNQLQTLNASVARGAVIGVAFGLYDVERKRSKCREKELERQVERLEEFASIVSHDLRSPLTVARGHLELLQLQHELDEEHTSQMEFAHERMIEIIEDSLALARGGHEVTDPEPVALEEVATTAWKTVGGVPAALHIETDETVEADRDRLQRLLENLFRNSIEHSSMESKQTVNGEITVRQQPTATDGTAGEPLTMTVGRLVGDAGFFVADNGPGIPVADRERVFEAGVSNSGSGSGLGLAIVRRIAQAHGWEVRLTAAETGGARFEFHIQ